ncbi:hypothetical protein ABEX78_21590 [Priestia megaterium]
MKTAYFVIGIAFLLILFSIMRLFGFEIPVSVIASFSIVAALTSISDLLEIIKVKRYQNIPLILALIFFVGALFIWIGDFSFNSTKYAPILGDCFTILGLGLVIGIFGYKEIPTKQTLGIRHYRNMQYEVIEYDYQTMLDINDTIESLKAIDAEVIIVDNQIHDGWLQLEAVLDTYPVESGPFVNSLHQRTYQKFSISLEKYTILLANASDPRPLGNKKRDLNVMINGELVSLTRTYISDLEDNDFKTVRNSLLLDWGKLKDEVNDIYTRERRKYKKD